MSRHNPDCDVNDINPDGIQKPCNCGASSPASPGSVIGDAGICWAQSDGKLGWVIRRIERATQNSVTLNDGVSFCSPCFAGAAEDDIWAVCHEPGGACFGQVRRAILLEPARRVYSENDKIRHDADSTASQPKETSNE